MPSPITPPFALQASQLTGGHGSPAVIQQLDFNWPAGVSWIGGDEGSGKTTLLRLLAGDLTPTAGVVRVPPGGIFWADLQSAAHDETTVQACWESLRLRCPQWREPLHEDLTEELGMRPHLHKRLNMLSTGSRRKVMLVAALASGAAVTLLDQPFVSLDQVSIGVIQSFLSEASSHPTRAWLVADYEAPQGVPLASVLELCTPPQHAHGKT